jgi:hypothetical protein
VTVSQILKAPWGRVLYAMRWVCAPSLSGLWACPTVRVPCSRRAHGGRGWELPIRTCTNSEALIQAVHNGLGRLGLGIPRLSGVTSALAPPISLLSASNSTHFGAVPLMRATLVLSLCKLGLVTQASRLRSRPDLRPCDSALCLFSPAHASGSQNP